MLDYDKRKRLMERGWGKPQERADFNKNMGRKLKRWLKELPDMILILENLPPRVIENANLLDNLPMAVRFMDTFLEKANPLPVGLHESHELRNFWNYITKLGEEDIAAIDPESSAAKMITMIGNDKYFLHVISWTASPGEIKRSELLKSHIDNLQKYINPNVIANSRIRPDINDLTEIQKEVVKAMGIGSIEIKIVAKNESMPTIPPSEPQIIYQPTKEES
jgi:hypothetical protein